VKNYYSSPKRGKVVKKKKSSSISERPPWAFDKLEQEDNRDQVYHDNIRQFSIFNGNLKG
jgi:hypothetical protein